MATECNYAVTLHLQHPLHRSVYCRFVQILHPVEGKDINSCLFKYSQFQFLANGIYKTNSTLLHRFEMSRGFKLFEIWQQGAESRINFLYTFTAPTLALDSILLASFHTALYLLTLALLDLTDLLQCCTVILHFDSNLLFLASFISK